jgi:hypothetical protein
MTWYLRDWDKISLLTSQLFQVYYNNILLLKFLLSNFSRGFINVGDTMKDEQYLLDMIIPKLTELFRDVWGKPKDFLNKRQALATLFAMRALRRIVAVSSLFFKGLYIESHPLVRVGYEDWLYLAYLLRKPGDSRCYAFGEGIYKLDARVYDGFKALCGQVIADRYFGELPDKVSAFVTLPRSKTKAPSFSTLADDVGLRRVHDFVYSYLSGLSHPIGRFNDIFDLSKGIVARAPRRDQEKEAQLTFWFTWFTSRILVLAAREFGVDYEHFIEEYLLPIATVKGPTLETCVFVREYQNT